MPINTENDEKYSNVPFEKYGQTFNSAEGLYKNYLMDELMHGDDTLYREHSEIFNLIPIERREKLKSDAEALIAKDNALKGII